MKKLFFAALIALAGFTACGTKNVETAATEATEQREVGGGDIHTCRSKPCSRSPIFTMQKASP